jgi:AAA ATPase domain
MEETPPPLMIMPHLVGRASQLATLQPLVEQAKRGGGHLVLISGEAGIGKSRLVAEVKTSATTQGFLLLQGNCFPIRTVPGIAGRVWARIRGSVAGPGHRRRD